MIGLLVVARSLGRGLASLARDPKSRGLLTLTAGLIAIGAFFYRRVEDMSWVDSVYFTVVTLTTVGYGDLSPQTTAGKIFTMFYILIGIGILVAVISEVASHIITASNERLDENDAAADDA